MKKTVLIMFTMLLLSSNAFAEWTLSNEESMIYFISIKKSNVGEIHHFTELGGTITDNGMASLDINLASVETNIPIRNDRMKSMLFNVEKFAQANLSGTIDLEKLKNLKVGESYKDSVKFKLSLHGMTQGFSSDMRVTKVSKNQILVTSLAPVIIDAGDYKLTEGIEKLREVANLPSISTMVPVTYNLIFNKK